MYKLTDKMEQHLISDLQHYHQLFAGGRCSGRELEELIFRAICSDSSAQDSVNWLKSRNELVDIEVKSGNQCHRLEVKSGSINGRSLVLSGERLGRFNGDISLISAHINGCTHNVVSVAYQSATDIIGKRHYYQLSYVDQEYLRYVESDSWEANSSSLIQTNECGVEFSLRKSLSWQLWWKIPFNLVERGQVITINQSI